MSSNSDDPSIIPPAAAPSSAASSDSHVTVDSDLLERYVLGALRPDEIERATAYFTAPERARVVEQAMVWAAQEPGVVPPNRAETFEELWRQICNNERLLRDETGEKREIRLGGNAVGTQTLRSTRQRDGGFSGRTVRGGMAGLGTRTLRGWLRFGGIAAVMVGVILFVRRASNPWPDVVHVYATTAQQQAIVNLSEGTRMTLAPQTTVRVLQLGTHARTLVLDHGEAYFEVAHASGLPFAIQSGRATIHVLGTTFFVRHARDDASVHVAVADGKVRMVVPGHEGARAADVTLAAGQAGDVTDSTTIVSAIQDSDSGTEWTSGRIVFHHTPVATVLQTISHWYGYHFHYADETLGTQNVTMMISTRSSAEALAALERVLGVNLNIVGDTITLIPQAPRAGDSVPRVRTYDVWTPTREVGR